LCYNSAGKVLPPWQYSESNEEWIDFLYLEKHYERGTCVTGGRVGNGETINIWNDPWILRGRTRRVITPRGQNVLSRVSDLIDPSSGSWDVDLLEQTFWEEDVELIKSNTFGHG